MCMGFSVACSYFTSNIEGGLALDFYNFKSINFI